MILHWSRTTEKRQAQLVTPASYFFISMDMFSNTDCRVNPKVGGMCVNWRIQVGKVFKREYFSPVLYKSKTKSVISLLVLHFSASFFNVEMTVVVTSSNKLVLNLVHRMWTHIFPRVCSISIFLTLSL